MGSRLLHKIPARRDSVCAICKGEIGIGDPIGQPYVRNSAGGNRYSSCWYCLPCAEDIHEIGVQDGYLSIKDMLEDRKRRAPALQRIAHRLGRNTDE